MGAAEAKGAPTKELFVYVLGKDISLIAAIIDLVDNSVDGARRLRSPTESPTDTESFQKLWIHITANENEFKIADNCGGIPLKTAVEYAFRFGRPPSAKEEEEEFGIPKYATGQFGVGMKRALFKLGTHFTVDSATKRSRFHMDVDVDDWLQQDEDDWHFDIDDAEDGIKVSEKKIGTTIVVDELHDTIADDLADKKILSELQSELAHRHLLSIHKGLVIKLNGMKIDPDTPRMIQSESIVPAYRRLGLNGGAPIKAEIVCGVSTGPSRESGWSVFLNDRMVLLNDKTELTGWGNKEEKRIPRWHGQYGRFRGFAFLSCSETSRLPWDTTKTGLDVDQAVYRRIESEMIALMEPVIRFLDDVDKETTHVNNEGEPGPLLTALDVAEESLFEVLEQAPAKSRRSITREFQRPDRVIVEDPAPATQSIQFSRPKDEVAALKDFFGVSSASKAGEHAWQFVFEVEDL